MSGEQTQPTGIEVSTNERRKPNKLARRAVFAAAGLGVCAAGVVATPKLAEKAGEITQQQLDDAFKNGVENGRQAILAELAQLEGITLDGAIGVAELTKLAVRYIVLPVARVVSSIEGNALGLLAGAVGNARNALKTVNIDWTLLGNLQDLLTSWQNNVNLLPVRLEQYSTADIDSAEAYLRALKKLVQEGQKATPTPKK